MTKRVDVRLLSNNKDYLKWASKPSFATQKVFDNNLVTIHKSKSTLTLNKPASVVMGILIELSKVSLYEFHYDYMKTKYGKKLILWFTYTDSSVYEIETKNVYDGFSEKKEMLDFSICSGVSKYYDDLKALVLGKMKDELVEIIGIKLKIYSIIVSNSSKYKKVKGLNKNVVAIINHNEYKDAFLD